MVLLEYSFVSYYFTRRTFNCIHLQRKQNNFNQPQEKQLASLYNDECNKTLEKKLAENLFLKNSKEYSFNDKKFNCLRNRFKYFQVCFFL